MSSNDTMAGFGTVLGMFGSIEEGEATSQSLDSQAKMQRQNAQLAEQKAQADSLRLSVFADRTTGSIKSSYAANGIASNSGTVRAVLQASGQNAELDRLNIIHGGQIRALNYNNQASLDEFGANQALTGSYFDALAKAFSGGSKAYARDKTPGGSEYEGGGGSDPFENTASNSGGPAWFYGDNPSPHAQPSRYG